VLAYLGQLELRVEDLQLCLGVGRQQQRHEKLEPNSDFLAAQPREKKREPDSKTEMSLPCLHLLSIFRSIIAAAV
jgi:hypothetical protein